MKGLGRLYSICDSSITFVGSILIGMSAILIAAQALARYLRSPFTWTEEVAQFCFIISAFLGASSVERESGHIKLTAFTDLLPKRLGSIVLYLNNILLILTLSFTLAGSFMLYPSISKLTSSAAEIPIRWIYTGMNIGLIWWIVNAIHSILSQRANADPDQ